MDGWGINGRSDANATLGADTPNLKLLTNDYAHTTLDASGLAVGLPEGQMGNSEVGHLTLGSGRVIYQELTRINKAVNDGKFEKSPLFVNLVDGVKDGGGALHLLGLLSDGGVHSHIDHLYALLDAASSLGLKEVYVHAFLDGRDTPPTSGIEYVKALESRLKDTGTGAVATVTGRYYAMDRDKRWDRVRKAYDAMTAGAGEKASDPVSAVEEAYRRGETDEFVLPTVITDGNKPVGPIKDKDAVLFFNFRSDRARELTEAFVAEGFDGFSRRVRPKLSRFVTMTEYGAAMNLPALFTPQEIKNLLGEVLSRNGICQFRVSETEKYAHVTFFFNGGIEKPFSGEERLLVPSVKDVPTYDKKPEMRASEIADAALEKIREGRCAFMLMNFANGDMVGHTGEYDAAVAACEAVDKAVGRVVFEAVEHGWYVIITSDHGNAEQMVDYETGKPHTAHTTNPVPFILVGDALREVKLKNGGGLQDVAPTVLKLLGLKKPDGMEGEPLF